MIKGRFQAVDLGGYSVYALACDGQVAYGVPCVNAGHSDWMLFDSAQEALEYKEFMSNED